MHVYLVYTETEWQPKAMQAGHNAEMSLSLSSALVYTATQIIKGFHQ